MDDRPVITIIKNGEEKVITFNVVDILSPDRKLKDIIYNKISIKDKVIRLGLDKDIEFIYIKDYVFKKDVMIDSKSSNTILILDNPIFEKEILEISNVSSLEIIKPIFKINGKIEISNVNDINIVLDNRSSKINMYVNDVDNFVLDSSSCLLYLKLNWIKNIFLKNFSSDLKIIHSNSDWWTKPISSRLILEDSYLLKKELTCNHSTVLDMKLVNSKIIDCNICGSLGLARKIVNLSLEDSMISLSEDITANLKAFLEFVQLKYLNLKSSSIKVRKWMSFEKLEKIIFSDSDADSILDNSSYLEALEYIIIKDKKIKNLEDGCSLILNKNSVDKNVLLKRQELKYVLQKYKEKLEEENAKKVKELKK